jgi:hypothetical protein
VGKEIQVAKLSELGGRKYRWQNCQNCEEGNTGGKTVRTVRKEIQVAKLLEL